MTTPKKKSEKNKKVWVEVEVNKYTDGITVFRGKISLEDLKAWEAGELIDCAIKLENTYWYSENSICILGKGKEAASHYTGDTYIRVDTIMLIFILRENSYPEEGSPKLDNIVEFPGRSA
ncbi:MAG TPA: hypothetical protein VJ205_01745 [Gammaproteobacteria bacterium]|nr:hypothetical protein [Gammaproteobacteria bacterium]